MTLPENLSYFPPAEHSLRVLYKLLYWFRRCSNFLSVDEILHSAYIHIKVWRFIYEVKTWSYFVLAHELRSTVNCNLEYSPSSL